MWLIFVAGQGFIAARLAIKLHFLASQTALFQRSLAHARFVAASARPREAPVVEHQQERHTGTRSAARRAVEEVAPL